MIELPCASKEMSCQKQVRCFTITRQFPCGGVILDFSHGDEEVGRLYLAIGAGMKLCFDVAFAFNS